MKPNPCMWCGEPARKAAGSRGYYCPSYVCENITNSSAVDFPTWQKNNPLPETNCAVLSEIKPHQFKVGEWIKVIEEGNECFGKKFKITRVEQDYVHIGKHKFWWKFQIMPCSHRLKRKEIRERLKYIMDYTKDCPVLPANLIDDLNKLIEEI